MSVVDAKSSVAEDIAPLDAGLTGVAVPTRLRTGLAAVKHRLGRTELRRRLWHMLPGVLPVFLWPVPHADPLSMTLRLIILGIIIGLGIAIFVHYRKIQRDADNGRFTAVIGYAASVIVTFLIFPSAIEIGFAVLAILAFGDGMATFCGKLLRGPALPWNREKTWSGFVAFLLFGAPLAALMYWQETHNLEALTPGVTYSTALLCCGVATFIAAVAESIPSRINDNIRVGVTAILAMAISQTLFVGW